MSNDLAISQDACSPVIAVIPENHHADHIQHVQSDCGHYGSPQVKRSHSLLRNFSLRSRNTLSLRKVNRVHCSPLPPSTSRPANVITKSATASTDSSHSDTNSLSSTWKKWKPKGVTTAPGAQDGDLIIPAHHDTLSWARKSSLFSPFLSVRRLILPFQIPLSSSASSDDSPCVVLRPLTKEKPVQLCLDAIQDEDDNIVGNAGIVGKLDGWVDLKLTTSPSSQPPPLLPPLPPSSSTSSPSSPLPAQPILRPSSSSSSPSLNVNPSLPLFTSTESSNPKPSISQNRRAQFTLGDESDLDCDSLAFSVSAMINAGRSVVPANDSAPSASIAMHRPPLTRREAFDCESRDQLGTSAPAPNTSMTNDKSLRRWTLSSALTDEDISDEGLAKELERMRKMLEWDCTPIDRDGHDSSSLFPSPPSPSNRWMITQRALLTTRELILTERHYLSSLILLLRPGSTLTPVPEMMVSYVKELVGVSERLLKGMEEEPSVRGVAEVFVGLGVDEVESAFAGWCGVVGKWFQGDLADPQTVYVKRKRKRFSSSVGTSEEHSSMVSEHEGSAPGLGETSTGEHGHTSPLMRNVSTWRKSMPSIAGLGESGAWRKENKDRDKDGGDSTYGRGRMSPTFDPVPSSALRIKSTSINKPIRKPAVRDLAILPTQRVMRYVLLYRDLLANTSPSSSSYPIVERAVEAACRIAEKCDRAQCNDAFVAGSTHDSSSGNSSSGSSSSTSMVNNGSGCTRSKSQRFHGKRVMTMPEPSSTAQPSSESPTKSHFFLSSSPVSTLPSTSSSLPQSSSSSKPIPSFLPPRASPNKIRKRSTNPIPPLPPPPPSSFNSKIPIPRSGRSSGSLSTSSTGSSTTSATTTPPGGTLSPFSSSPSASSFSSLSPSSPLSFLSTPPPPPLCLPKSSSSSSVSSRTPLSAV